MASGNTVNLLQGPVTMYVAPFSTAEPAAIGTTPAAPWVNVGFLNGGLKFSVTNSFDELIADQIATTAEMRITKTVITAAVGLAEPTLANWNIANNSMGTVTVGTSNTFAPQKSSIFVPTYQALIFDGLGDGGNKRRTLIRKALQTDNPETDYTKDGQTILSLTFTCLWVSDTIDAYAIQNS